jgi:dTDP-4-dehydrorhamnose reductase
MTTFTSQEDFKTFQNHKPVNFVVFGSTGQLGTEVCNVLKARKLPYVGLPYRMNGEVVCNIADPQMVSDAFYYNVNKDSIVINCTGYCNVVKAEEERFDAYDTNAVGPLNLAEHCRLNDARLIHISTDYVFDGESHRPYLEGSETGPLNQYGKSKLMGEQLIGEIYYENSLIIRTSSLYGNKPTATKGNFLTNIDKSWHEGRELNIVADLIMTPTYAGEFAEAVIDLSLTDNIGTIHVTNEGQTTWYGFAEEYFRQMKGAPILKIAQTDRYKVPHRPFYTVLDNSNYNRMVAKSGLYKMSTWQDALTKYIKNL